MTNMIAYCGIDCAVCPAYLATIAGDQEALAKLAKEWGADAPPEVATPENLRCSGCREGSGKYLCFFCNDCAIRNCAIERKLESCAYCDDLDGCEKIEPCWQMSPDAKKTIEALRASMA